jgi:ABC-type transporter Mla subunit MlaD
MNIQQQLSEIIASLNSIVETRAATKQLLADTNRVIETSNATLDALTQTLIDKEKASH